MAGADVLPAGVVVDGAAACRANFQFGDGMNFPDGGAFAAAAGDVFAVKEEIAGDAHQRRVVRIGDQAIDGGEGPFGDIGADLGSHFDDDGAGKAVGGSFDDVDVKVVVGFAGEFAIAGFGRAGVGTEQESGESDRGIFAHLFGFGAGLTLDPVSRSFFLQVQEIGESHRLQGRRRRIEAVFLGVEKRITAATAGWRALSQAGGAGFAGVSEDARFGKLLRTGDGPRI